MLGERMHKRAKRLAASGQDNDPVVVSSGTGRKPRAVTITAPVTYYHDRDSDSEDFDDEEMHLALALSKSLQETESAKESTATDDHCLESGGEPAVFGRQPSSDAYRPELRRGAVRGSRPLSYADIQYHLDNSIERIGPRYQAKIPRLGARMPLDPDAADLATRIEYTDYDVSAVSEASRIADEGDLINPWVLSPQVNDKRLEVSVARGAVCRVRFEDEIECFDYKIVK